jgi:drug/metabolite transporter (DMT)-like permease
MPTQLRAYAILHFCVVIWGFTAILGKLIRLDALPLVWWRVALCALALFFIVSADEKRKPGKAGIRRLIGIGAIIGVHWLCFFGAIKLSNASVGVASFATVSFFSSLLEPILTRKRIVWYELLLGAIVVPGVLLITGGLDLNMRLGLAVGILSALLAALFTALNKIEIDKYGHAPLTITLYEMLGAVMVTSVGLLLFQYPVENLAPRGDDWYWLFVLAFVCTLFVHYLVLGIMTELTAFTINLVTNLEPIYGIALAALVFQEHRELSVGFYVGAGLILLSVFGHPLLKHFYNKKAALQHSQGGQKKG